MNTSGTIFNTTSTIPANSVKVLDHGYVRLIESWGSDERIIEAARMSTNKGFQGWGPKHSKDCLRPDLDYMDCECNGESGDEKLLRYLYEHKHSSPFEFGGLILEIQAPIFVFREWMRHRTFSYNEMSARYTPLPDVNYIPTVERLLAKDSKNKQASSTGSVLDEAGAERFRNWVKTCYVNNQSLYQAALDMGVPKELARIHLPVGRYSRMRASANLRNWLAFLTLRMDKAAQWEIRQYANEVGNLVSRLFPRTWELFVEGRRIEQ